MSSKFDSDRRFDTGDTGKRVITADGDVVGDIDRVKGGTAFVKPEPRILSGHGSIISNQWVGVEPLPLDEQQVESVTEEAVVLKAVDSKRQVITEDR